ncbi:MAG: class I SAM-dependent methyltransferase [Treponema sp.]|jgi:23S rRNA G2069 N7-methylase RlmK/C1962 C5-methylase RlmI|nr:class I SAM-dependent methyltransferase [Treponema sp.]
MSQSQPKIANQCEMLANRLRKRRRHLGKWAKRTGAGLYRLYDRDIPEIPLVLDWVSGNREGVPGNALTGALYRRPYEKDEAEEAAWLSAMKDAVGEALEIDRNRIFIKERRHTSHNGQENGGNRGQYEKMADRGFTMDLREGGLNFRVNLSGYLDSGLFPDRRLLRSKIREEARGKRVLNLFAYTCSFSVYAAGGGALEIDSVDLSHTYLDWGMENFALNGFKGTKMSPWDFSAKAAGFVRGRRKTAVQAGLPPYRFIRGDVLPFLREAGKAGLVWDLIILDPPTFSNSKKMEDALDIKRDYPRLIANCLELLSSTGKLWISINARGLSLVQAAGDGSFPGTEFTDMTEKLRDEDFRDKRIPRCCVLERRLV